MSSSEIQNWEDRQAELWDEWARDTRTDAEIDAMIRAGEERERLGIPPPAVDQPWHGIF